jgi:NADPH:quinone reductase-like Zn-dependent oxidoreductase
MPENKAAWITAERAHPFSIQSAPLPTAGPGELVIKNAAVAVNPVDWKIQADGHYLPKDKYPFVLGEDCAGIVEEVGKGVEGFEKGDRVISYVFPNLTLSLNIVSVPGLMVGMIQTLFQPRHSKPRLRRLPTLHHGAFFPSSSHPLHTPL